MNTSKEVASAIITGGFTVEQLTEISDALRFAKSRVAQQNMFQMRVGSQVKFNNSRTGTVMVGEVVKVNRIKMVVKVGMTRWNVPASMLSPA
jgi:transcription elongation GreA/GreB family factor